MRRRLPLLAAAAAAAALVVPPLPAARASDAPPPGPADRIYFLEGTGGTVGYPDGQAAYRLVASRDFDQPTYRSLVGRSTVDRDFLQVSPDGTTLAYLRFDPDGTVSLWTLTVDGMDHTRRKVFATKNTGFSIRWTPDSRGLVFNDTHSADPRVRLYDLATGRSTVVPNSKGVGVPTIDPSDPRWLYGVRADGALVKMTVSGGTLPTPVPGAPASKNGLPTVAADGTVVFQHRTVESDTAPKGDLISVKDGVAKVIATGEYNARPTIGPDGRTVWFDRFRSAAYGFIGDVWSVPADGSAPATRKYETDSEDEFWASAGYISTAVPTKPVTAFTVTPNGTHPVLHWTRPTDDPEATHVYVCRAVGTKAPANCGAPIYKGSAESFVDTAVLNQTYSYSVLTANAFGNRTATAVSVTMQAIAAPTVSITSPTSTGTTTLPFAVSWSGGDGHYDVSWSERYTTGEFAAYQPWLSATEQTAATFGAENAPVSVLPGSAYYVSVVSHDQYGNVTAPGINRGIVPFDDTQGLTQYGKSGWVQESRAGRWGGSVHSTTLKGAGVLTRMTGSGYSIVGERCTTCGAVRIYVDGVLKATVDTYASSYQQRQVLWTGSLGTVKARNIRVENVGTAGRPRFNVDAFAAWR